MRKNRIVVTKSEIVKSSLALLPEKITVYDLLKRFCDIDSVKDRPGSGQPSCPHQNVENV